jgi:hypothetical protein
MSLNNSYLVEYLELYIKVRFEKNLAGKQFEG